MDYRVRMVDELSIPQHVKPNTNSEEIARLSQSLWSIPKYRDTVQRNDPLDCFSGQETEIVIGCVKSVRSEGELERYHADNINVAIAATRQLKPLKSNCFCDGQLSSFVLSRLRTYPMSDFSLRPDYRIRLSEAVLFVRAFERNFPILQKSYESARIMSKDDRSKEWKGDRWDTEVSIPTDVAFNYDLRWLFGHANKLEQDLVRVARILGNYANWHDPSNLSTEQIVRAMRADFYMKRYKNAINDKPSYDASFPRFIDDFSATVEELG